MTFLTRGGVFDINAANDHLIVGTRQVTLNEMRADNADVAIKEQQIIVLGCLGKEITDGGTPRILFATDVLAMGEISDALVGLDDRRVGRAVVGNDHLIADGSCIEKGKQLADLGITNVIVGGNQNR